METTHRESLKDLLPKGYIPEQGCKFDKIISFGGNWASGSSVVGNFLNEFPNIDVVGQIYDGKNSFEQHRGKGGELHFFVMTWFCKFAKLMNCSTDTEKDIIIKMFINDMENCYKSKMVFGEQYSPHIYNEEFIKICTELLLSVLDLTPYDKEIIKNKNFQNCNKSSPDIYDDCSFINGSGKYKHIFYRVKQINPYEFALSIRRFIEKFFNLYYNENNILAGDQLCYNQSILEIMNYYLFDRPIRQISVYRDPRDQFFSIYRYHLNFAKHHMENISTFVNFYKKSRQLDYVAKNPYDKNMILRFEDLVLKYDEMTTKIIDFLDLDAAMHIHKKKFFDPKISVNNIGSYKLFSDQNFMRKIEEALGEFCYYPEKENLSEDAWNLLNSRTFFMDKR